MTETESPPPDSESDRRDRPSVDRVVPEIIRRMIESGAKNLSPEHVRQALSDLKLPKDVLSLMLGQMDETKNGLYRAVAKELRDFLEHTNFSEEVAKALTMLSFEIKMEVRFIPNDSRVAGASPDIRARVKMKRNGVTEPPPPPDDANRWDSEQEDA